MSISSNKPFFHVIDTETTGLSHEHKQTGLLQLYSTNLPQFQGARPFDPRTLVKPARGYRDINNKLIQFSYNFTEGQDVLTAAQRMAQYGEEETTGHFFAAASEELARKRRFIVGGWNPSYDIGLLESITQRYASLAQHRGFFQRPGVKIIGLEKPFLEFSHWYAQANPEFAARYMRTGPSTPISATLGPGIVPRSAEEMKYVPGWSVENITKAAGGREKLIGAVGQFHEAVTDVELEQQLFEKFRFAKKVAQRGYSFDIALSAAGVLPEGQTAETFFKQVFSSSWSGYIAKQAEKGIAVTPPKPNAFAGQATKILVFAAAAAAAYAIANSKRGDRQNQITGLQDTGVAQEMRHKLTDFGSGWVGQDNNSDNTLKFLLGAGAVYGLHKTLHANWADYAEGVYQTLRKIEERSPAELFRTFGLSQLASSYRPAEVFLKPEQLFLGNQLTETGRHLQRLIGVNALDERFKQGMRFKRTSAVSPYLELEGMPGYKVRFAERGRLTGSSARYGMELREPMEQRYFAETPWGQAKEYFQHIRERQTPRTPLSKKQAFAMKMGGEEAFYHPLYGRRPGFMGGVQSAYETTSRVAFEAAERPLRLLRDIGLGVNYGSYNKLMHIPFVQSGGLLNKLIFGRVLPIYAAVTLARYANYQMGGAPAHTLASLPLRAHMAWAEATEQVPGLRSITDKYAEIVPGPQYGPLALPIGAGAIATVLGHYLPVARGTVKYATRAARTAAARATFRKGAGIGLALMAPFIPGMIGSRQTPEQLQRIYSGEEEIPVRAGRWWDVGSTPFQGGRIKYFRQHWYASMQAHAEMTATYGSEDAYWEHHPLLHPFKYINDPYWVEKANYYSRPYPITSPAFSNIPLVGSALAATFGRLIKPPVRMHEREWDINNYTLYSPRLEPNMALGGLPPSTPREEFSLKDITKRELISFAEYTGLPGFIATTVYGAAGPRGTPGKDVILQGSRQMTSWSRQYYQRELGAVSGVNPNEPGAMPFGYSEPLRRFIQPEKLAVQANEIPNTMPRWMPGEDYMINFRTGDPYARIPEGAARLPGPAYGELHPELRGLNPDQYPDFYRYKILADVAPYSKEYLIYRAKIRTMAQKDTKLQIQYEHIEDQVRQMKESSLNTTQRRFTAPVENISGTIKRATAQGIELSEYPGRFFTFSSIGTSASDLSAVVLGEKNNQSRTENARTVEKREAQLQEFLAQQVGMKARLVVPLGTEEHATEARAVIFIDDVDLNKAIIDQGMGKLRKDLGGAEAQAMYSSVQQSLGRYAETMAFTGEGGPLSYVPTPFHTKYWNERTALALYQEQEVYGARMRRWQRPFHDMVAPWARGLYHRVTGKAIIPPEVEYRRNIDTLTDELDYLRAQIQASAHPENRGRYTSQAKRTNIGGNLFGNPQFVSNSLPRREKLYFQAFLQETDPEKRKQILESVSPELARTLTAQWVKKDAMIARESGKEIPPIEEGGVLFTKQDLESYRKAKTDLTYSDYVRSKNIAKTFSTLGFNLPGPGSPLWSEGMDYEDVKLKIIQDEGYDYHDFNIYDDRVSTLWRKPYIDGAVRELTSGGTGNTEQIRQTIEQIIIEGSDKYPTVMANTSPSRNDSSSVNIDVDEQGDKAIMTDIRRNEDEYRSETAE